MDVALLQEAKQPSAELSRAFEVAELPWRTAGLGVERPWSAAVARFTHRVSLRTLPMEAIGAAREGNLAVSLPGSLAAAELTIRSTGEVVTVASLYGAWERPWAAASRQWIYADASVHRLVSDLSALISRQKDHKLIAAGDLNILYGYGEEGSQYWAARYETVFARFAALGLSFAGPQAPEGGHQAHPWPKELPKDSRNVPTYRTRRQKPGTATRQLDFVFASERLKARLRVRALNGVEEWGPSDHCRILIELETE